MPTCPFCEKELPAGTTTCPTCGVPISDGEMPGDIEEQILALLAEGQKIEAVKRYREATGVGLSEAKAAVEALQAGGSLPERAPSPEAGTLEAEVLKRLPQGKIAAIKYYREQSGQGLKESKEAVEAIAERHGAVIPKSGCLGVLLLIGVAISVAVGSLI